MAENNEIMRMKKLKFGFLHSLIRPEEKSLLREFQARAEIDLVMIDTRKIKFALEKSQFDFDLVLDRSIDYLGSLNILRLFESFGVTCLNSSFTANIRGDKLQTSLALKRNKVPQPSLRVAFSRQAALEAMEEMGFPVVLKPAVGSWGRLVSKLNDRDTAETILAHKETLGGQHHRIFYIQKYIEKGGRDIRSIVIGDECVAATYRTSDHWITNAARAGRSSDCPITLEIQDLSVKAARAVGGGILAVDLFETENGLLVNEINHTMEFKSFMAATGKNIPGLVVDYIINGKCPRSDGGELLPLMKRKEERLD